ncbi:hypothetical protein, partial [uncultured Endozoicomonas sp.]|uniref:hypothetical protein n=1 Tax=uncultured Endozoicomonas sp. TaxID=432652 RepID=UPI00262485A8
CGLCFSTSSVHLAAVRLQERAGIAAADAFYSDNLLPVLSLKTYIDGFISGNRENSVEDIQKTFATKSGGWSYEQEARIFSTKKGWNNIDPDCIQAVYLGEKMPDWKKRAIKACLDAKGGQVDLCEVAIDTCGREYQLRIRNYSG